MAQTCYRHPEPRDRRLLLLLRAADLPRVHDPDPGRHALPGVRQPAHPGGPNPTGTPSGFGAFPATVVLIAINVIVYLIEVAQRRRRASANSASRRSTTWAASGARRWTKAATGGGRSPRASSTSASSTSASTCTCCSSSAGCWSPRSARRASSSSTSPRSWPARSSPCWSTPNTVSAGASGAIFGVLGATFVIARGRRLDSVAGQIGFLILFNLVFTFADAAISIGAHVGGLVGGVLCGLLIAAGERGTLGEPRAPRTAWRSSSARWRPRRPQLRPRAGGRRLRRPLLARLGRAVRGAGDAGG